MLIQGKAKWSKVTGAPSWGYKDQYKEWSIDVYLNEETAQKLKDEGLGAKLKDKGNGTYITFKRKELKADGSPNQPIRVVDHRGQPWDQKVKIGNDSVVNVNFAINEYGKGEKSANILSMQVWELVEYGGGDGFPTREDDTKVSSEGDWESDAA